MPDTDAIIYVDATEVLFDVTLDAAAAASVKPSFSAGKDMVLSLVMPNGERVNLPVLEGDTVNTPRAPLTIPENWSCTFDIAPGSRAALDRFFAAYEARFWSPAKPRLNAHQKAQAAAHAQRQAAHKIKMADKARLHADPAARAASLEALNGPVIQRRRLAHLQAIAQDIAAQNNVISSECMAGAAKLLAQIEDGVQFRAAVKAHRAGRSYPADGTLAHAATRYRAAVAVAVAA